MAARVLRCTGSLRKFVNEVFDLLKPGTVLHLGDHTVRITKAYDPVVEACRAFDGDRVEAINPETDEPLYVTWEDILTAANEGTRISIEEDGQYNPIKTPDPQTLLHLAFKPGDVIRMSSPGFGPVVFEVKEIQAREPMLQIRWIDGNGPPEEPEPEAITAALLAAPSTRLEKIESKPLERVS